MTDGSPPEGTSGGWGGWGGGDDGPAGSRATDAIDDLVELRRTMLDAEAIGRLGGVAAAAAWARGLRLPDAGEVLLVGPEGTWPGLPGATCYVWPVEGGHCAGVLGDGPSRVGGWMTRVPTPREPVLWRCVWALVGPRLDALTLHRLAGPAADEVIALLEGARRRMPARGRAGRC